MKILFLFLALSSTAWGYVQVNPVRFYVNEVKFSHFTVRNTQNKPVHVEIENKYFTMKPDGKMLPENTGAKDELKKILFTPKTFTLPPGEKQVVRFFVKDSLNVPELRTFAHLLTEIAADLQEKGATEGSQSMSLTAKVAIAVPVIYRTKLDKTNIIISDEVLTQKENDCLLTANWKNKTHSSYINLEALNSEGKEVFKSNGISNYLPDYAWNLLIPQTKCKDIKKLKIFDVDNDVSVVSRDINQ